MFCKELLAENAYLLQRPCLNLSEIKNFHFLKQDQALKYNKNMPMMASQSDLCFLLPVQWILGILKFHKMR